MAARCKLPFALRPGLSPDDVMRTKEITKERIPVQRENKRKACPSPYPFSSSADAMKEGMGKNSGCSSTAPNLPRHPAPPPPPSALLPAPGAPGAPTQTPHSPRRPREAPAFPQSLQIGSPVLSGCISHWPEGPGPSSGSSISRSPSAPLSTGLSAEPSTPDKP